MGQFALGLRSLFIKAAVFVVMAALLAWALGGTLFPRPELARFEPVSFAGERWYWQIAVGGKKAGAVRWRLMIEDDNGKDAPFDTRTWAEVAGPVASDDALFIAGRATLSSVEPWRIERIDRQRRTTVYTMPDRLAVEQQLARIAAGGTIQDIETILRQRPSVLDPP